MLLTCISTDKTSFVSRFLFNTVTFLSEKLLALGKVQINLPFLSFLRNFVPTYYK